MGSVQSTITGPHFPYQTIMSVPTAALVSPDDFVNVARIGRFEHGRILRYAPEPTASTATWPQTDLVACTLRRPTDTGSMVAASDPGVRGPPKAGRSAVY